MVTRQKIQADDVNMNSVWKTITRRHFGHLRQIVGFNKPRTTVRVKEYTKKNRQHVDMIYSINLNTFVREHQHVKG